MVYIPGIVYILKDHADLLTLLTNITTVDPYPLAEAVSYINPLSSRHMHCLLIYDSTLTRVKIISFFKFKSMFIDVD